MIYVKFQLKLSLAENQANALAIHAVPVLTVAGVLVNKSAFFKSHCSFEFFVSNNFVCNSGVHRFFFDWNGCCSLGCNV